jgi:hypothetical protein
MTPGTLSAGGMSTRESGCVRPSSGGDPWSGRQSSASSSSSGTTTIAGAPLRLGASRRHPRLLVRIRAASAEMRSRSPRLPATVRGIVRPVSVSDSPVQTAP